jgi:hypothetical protein
MKKIIVEIKKDKDNTYFVKVAEDVLPSFQKMIINGCDNDTIVDFKFNEKDIEEVEVIDNKNVQE